MIEKETALNMLEDIKLCLYDENWKGKTLSTVKQYKRGLLVSINDEIRELVEKHKQLDEESEEAIELSQKMNEIIYRINNSV